MNNLQKILFVFLMLGAIAALGETKFHKNESHQIAQIKYKYFIFTQVCYRSLVQSMNITDFNCIKITFSKLMGYVLVIGGGIVKFPQIIRILVDRSVFGISYQSILFQSATNWITIIYSWNHMIPFSIFGENVFILAQNLVLIMLFVIFGYKLALKDSTKSRSTVTLYYAMIFIFALVIIFISRHPQHWPEIVIANTMQCQMVLFCGARFSQIYHIWKCKKTGSLSLITCGLNFLGNLGRLFTIFVEINDLLFATSVILATCCNFTILLQFFIYRNKTPKDQQKKNK